MGVSRVGGALTDSHYGAVCVGGLVAMAGKATAWFCGKLIPRVRDGSRLGRGSVLLGGAIAQDLNACPVQETLGRAPGSSVVTMLA